MIGRLRSRGDARINLDVLGRLGLTVVEVADETAWELHFAEIAGHDLIVDAIFGTGLPRRSAGFYETVVADINAAGVPIVVDRYSVRHEADTPHLIGDSSRRRSRSRWRAEAAAGPAARRELRPARS